MENKKTNRGFKFFSFKDTYEEKCTLQESSSVDPRIWLGINDPEIKYLYQGWNIVTHIINPVTGEQIEINSSKDFLINGRMHLNQQQVKRLIPHLEKFVKTGKL